MSRKFDFNEERYGRLKLGPGEKERVRQVLDLVGEKKVILDVGCGIGEIGTLLIQNKNKVYGVDISPTAAKRAGKRGLIAKHSDIEKEGISFRNNYFDVVVAGEVIEHVFDTGQFLEEIRKKLKKRGELVLTTPNLATLGRRLLLLIGRNPLIEVNLTEYSSGHIRYFVKDDLFRLIESHGFKINHFSSDLINFTADGKLNNKWLAQLFPSLGRTLIVRAVKQ